MCTCTDFMRIWPLEFGTCVCTFSMAMLFTKANPCTVCLLGCLYDGGYEHLASCLHLLAAVFFLVLKCFVSCGFIGYTINASLPSRHSRFISGPWSCMLWLSFFVRQSHCSWHAPCCVAIESSPSCGFEYEARARRSLCSAYTALYPFPNVFPARIT